MRGALLAILPGVVLMLAGCHFARHDGPVPQALVTSRQYSQQGVAAMEQAEWSKAEKILEKAVKTCPVDAEARRHYAEALWNCGTPREAIRQMEEASRLAPDDPTLHARIAEMHLALGETEVAFSRVDQALARDPKLVLGWTVRARLARAAGQPRQALADYHRALGLAPDDRQLLWETAQLYHELNEPQRALVTLQTLCETYTPGEEPPHALELLGRVYLSAGRAEDAAETLERALQRGNPSAELLCALGQAQGQVGRHAAALQSAREALALDPRHAASLELLRRIELAQQTRGTTGALAR